MFGHMRSRLRFLAPALFVAASLSAQGTARVRGLVFDSVAMEPLSAAVVQLALINTSGGQQTFSATTDSAGRYDFSTLPAGSYGIGFQHAALTALGLDSPLRALRLADGATLDINLAIPPGNQVRSVACGGAPADSSDGLVAGYIFDAARGAPLSTANVTVHWLELAVVDKKFKAVPRDIAMTTGDDGAFRICGVAGEAQVQLSVAHAGFRPFSTEIAIPPGGALRRDVRLADSAVARGTASVSGRALHSDGSVVATGSVLLPDLSIEVPIANGQFTLTGLPQGTWPLEVRVIGYEPQTVLIDAVDGAPTHAVVKVGGRIQVLDAVTVFGKANTASLKTLEGIADRRRTAFGTTFLPGNSWLQSALYISDVLQAARGFRYLSMDSVIARGCIEATSILGTQRRLKLYLEGQPFLGDLSELQHQVQARDVLAIEAYPDPQSIPAIWRSNDACALVAVWTKR